MSSLFLFGAGASYGSGRCAPAPPPLGKDLFPALVQLGGAASRVPKDLAQLFTEDFEAGMDRFWAEHNTETTALLREMAQYFVQFEPMPNNCYEQLLHILGGVRKKAIFATTNYDLLIEHAVSRAGLLISYTGFPVEPGTVPLLKIHGSSNFLPELAGGGFSGISFDLSGSESGSILECGVRVATSTYEVQQFCAKQDSIAPALAMYSPSKRVLYCRAFVEAQQAAWAASTTEASRIFVIGVRVHPVDDHIWGALAASTCPLYYVGFEPEDFVQWASSCQRKNTFTLARTFAEALPAIASKVGGRMPRPVPSNSSKPTPLRGAAKFKC